MAHSVRVKHRDWRQRALRSHNAHRRMFAATVMIDDVVDACNYLTANLPQVLEAFVGCVQKLSEQIPVMTQAVTDAFQQIKQKAAQNDL